MASLPWNNTFGTSEELSGNLLSIALKIDTPCAHESISIASPSWEMTDPFSIIVGTAGLLDISYRVASYLIDIKVAAGNLDGEIATLSREIDSLIQVNQCLGDCARDSQSLEGLLPADSRRLQGLWQSVARMLQGCREAVENLEASMRGISGKKRSKIRGNIGGIKQQLRKQWKEKEFAEAHRQLSTYHGNLQVPLTYICM